MALFVGWSRAESRFNATLASRQLSADDFIDITTMPVECGTVGCESYSEPSLDACLPSEDLCPDNGCGPQLYVRDCYCNLQTGIYCAWACPWDPWFAMEDWFAESCPGSPAVTLDLSGLPTCARECLYDAIFESGCLTLSSNCFCAIGELFDCHSGCRTSEELSQLADWLQFACSIDDDMASTAVQGGVFTLGDETIEPQDRESIAVTSSRWRPSWDEIFIFVVIGITGSVGLGLWIFSCMVGRKQGKGDGNTVEVVSTAVLNP
ncbi:hypothetical protein S7711_10960 [Stachybotrys chartarum IBT 7711]|uniref:Uncharacterized protein n=1 Tax=Stachybotrys chartarum (strain CBS 109288 / IBT 7711) TaxID=1280523 RepID=A0A084BB13_STACB|nr:hypothetical protein S7711_10960 [Stachybotrys chartarum IBT 7711]KFA53031.1 hypothetical protein S40293_11013 [Stachybotrys chartarum IBT 40293]